LGDADKDKVKVYSASGSVTLFGQPLAGANVAFAPTGDQPTAFATTDDQGNFELTTYDFGDGAAEGTYKVVISKATTAPTEGGVEDEHADDTVVSSHGGGGDAGQASDLVPAQYTTSTDTPLTAEVKAGEDNVFPFEIK